jgi:D-alanyl-D-alanine carboxypeptidase
MPEYDYYWHLPGIRMGKMVQRNYNTLIGRYPGADGMKTGFICASGFNLVASATRDGRRLIAVVMGAPSSAARALKAAQLLERGFNSNSGLGWLVPSLGTVDTLQPINTAPPNLRDDMCGNHRKRPATEDEDDFVAANTAPDSPYATFLASLRPSKGKASLLNEADLGEPVLVFTGTKPPAPGTVQAGWGEPAKSKARKTATAKLTSGKDKAAKDKAGKDKDAAKETAKDKDASAPSDGGAATKPRAKKPKPAPAASSATQQTSQAR